MKNNRFTSLLRHLPRHSLLWTGIIITMVLSITQVGFSLLIRFITDVAIEQNLEKLRFYVALIIGLTVFTFIGQYVRSKLLGVFTEGGVRAIRSKLVNKLSTLSLGNFSEHHSGDLMSRATNDLAKLRQFILTTVPDIIRVPLIAVLSLVVLFIFNWQLTLISIGLMVIIIILSTLLGIPLGPISKRRQATLGRVNALTTDYIKGHEIARAYALEEELSKNYEKTLVELVGEEKRLERRRSAVTSLSQGLSIFPFLFTFILGGYYVIEEMMTMGSLLAFINLLNFVTFPLSRLPELIASIKTDLAAFSRIDEVFRLEDERVGGEDHVFIEGAPLVEFRGVSFKYPNTNQEVLKNIHFTVDFNESIALVGESGSGKSTLTKLILGYYDSYEGDILFGGHELRTWDLNKLRKRIAYVAQKPFLFPESIYENILYGKPDADPEMVYESAKKAFIEPMIDRLDEGYEAMIGELGSTLSGGQKQRITIARALIKQAPLLLLDEATSALDNEAERYVQEAIGTNTHDQASIVIAHRLSTIRDVDHIYVLKDGEIVERGVHEDLMALNGIYRKLYKRQGGGSDEEAVIATV